MSIDQKTKRDRAMKSLLVTDWAGVEEEAGSRTSAVLRALYADQSLITQLDLLVQDPTTRAPSGEWSLHEFQPAVRSSVRPHGPVQDIRAAFCFAASYRTYLYGVVLNPEGSDGPVVRYSFDGEETPVARTLAEFLSWPRRRRPAGYEPPAG